MPTPPITAAELYDEALRLLHLAQSTYCALAANGDMSNDVAERRIECAGEIVRRCKLLMEREAKQKGPET